MVEETFGRTVRRVPRGAFADRLGLTEDTLEPLPCSAVAEVRMNFDNGYGVTIGQVRRSLCPIGSGWEDEYILAVPVMEAADGRCYIWL